MPAVLYYFSSNSVTGIPSILATIAPGIAIVSQTAVVIGVAIALVQLSHLKKNRKSANFIALISSVHSHNRQIAEKDIRQYVVDMFLGLSVNTPELAFNDRELYWATRIVHLSHLNILAQMFVLSESNLMLRSEFLQWQEFAAMLVADLRGVTNRPLPKPYRDACSDLWKGIGSHEQLPTPFRLWLQKLTPKMR